MQAHTLELQQNNSLDLRLAIAGPGARAFAFILDFKFRSLAALSYFTLAVWLQQQLGGMEWQELLESRGRSMWLVALPTGAIYFLYHPVFEMLWRGRTPGKRLAGVRVVGALGQPPSLSQIFLRNVFRVLDSLPLGYGLGLITNLLSGPRQRIGDIAAGTFLVHDGLRAKPLAALLKSAKSSRLSADEFEFVHGLLARWSQLLPAQRRGLAHGFLAAKRRLSSGALTTSPTAVSSDDSTLLRELKALVAGE